MCVMCYVLCVMCYVFYVFPSDNLTQCTVRGTGFAKLANLRRHTHEVHGQGLTAYLLYLYYVSRVL